jgi:cellulose synthase/poly-beta-1,6-N-acetylglucosamine synthase-like glycosyltransferase
MGIDVAHERLLVAGGIVAFSDEAYLEASVRSLRSQQLPSNAALSGVWMVVSPGGDRTVDVARRIAAADPESVHLAVEPVRRGKSAAMGELMSSVQGDVLVMLNGDARAEEGAVAALLRAIPANVSRYAVMGRPVPERRGDGVLSRAIDLLWDVHHELHRATLSRAGGGTHLSDEIMLVPIGRLPPLPAGIVTDGAYLGAWLVDHGGDLVYAPDAQVRIVTPRTLGEHLLQRRRIHRGHRQVGRLAGRAPTVLGGWAARHPGDAVRMFRRLLRGRPSGWRSFGVLCLTEAWAMALARWDTLVHPQEPAAWQRIGGSSGAPASGTTPAH